MRTGILLFVILWHLVTGHQAVSQTYSAEAASEIFINNPELPDNTDYACLSYIVPVFDFVSGIVYEIELRFDFIGIPQTPAEPGNFIPFITIYDFDGYERSAVGSAIQTIPYYSNRSYSPVGFPESTGYFEAGYIMEEPRIRNYYFLNY